MLMIQVRELFFKIIMVRQAPSRIVLQQSVESPTRRDEARLNGFTSPAIHSSAIHIVQPDMH